MVEQTCPSRCAKSRIASPCTSRIAGKSSSRKGDVHRLTFSSDSLTLVRRGAPNAFIARWFRIEQGDRRAYWQLKTAAARRAAASGGFKNAGCETAVGHASAATARPRDAVLVHPRPGRGAGFLLP